MRGPSIEVTVGKRRYKVVGTRVWVQGFGTTGPGQKPHYNWVPVSKGSGSHKEAIGAVNKLLKH